MTEYNKDYQSVATRSIKSSISLLIEPFNVRNVRSHMKKVNKLSIVALWAILLSVPVVLMCEKSKLGSI